jgi:hypothetical protein
MARSTRKKAAPRLKKPPTVHPCGVTWAVLKHLCQNIADDTVVVLRGYDHSYQSVTFASRVDAELSDDGKLYEYVGDEAMFEGSVRTQVALIE